MVSVAIPLLPDNQMTGIQQVDDPPYLSVGTAVSAKYKGAFCEAKVSKVVRIVKCKVTYKMGLGTATVSDEQIKGPLRVGHTVQAKHAERKEFVEATIGKIQDCSQYTVGKFCNTKVAIKGKQYLQCLMTAILPH